MRPLVAVASTFFALAAAGQVKESINVHLVEVPVSVTDHDGNPVRNLSAANFEIFDEGHRRAITAFETIDFASADSLHATSPLNPAARRSFLLLFDTTFSTPAGRAKAQDAARNFIARGMQRRDVAAVATIDVERGVRMLTSFTTDRNLLTAAVSGQNLLRSSDPLQIAGVQTIEMPRQAESAGEHDDNRGNDAMVDIARVDRRLNDSYNRTRAERQIAQLAGIARTLRMLPGRKQVVFFSEGFEGRLVAGRDARASSDALSDLDLVLRGEAYKIDSDTRYGNSTTMHILDQMATVFRGADAVLDAVDIAGVRVQNDVQNGAKINSNEGLFLLSSATGGEVFHNSNDLNADIDRMLRTQEVVYVLGFQTPSVDAPKFHALKVRVTGVRGVRVQHRAGHWDGAPETALERVLTTAQIVLNDIPQDDVHIATLAVPFPTGKNAQVPVIVEINGSDLLRDAKSNVITAELYIYAFDDEGVVRDRMFQRLAVDAAKAGARLRASGIKYYATLSLPEGKYAIKSLVRVIDTDRKGFARTDIVVPRENDVVLLPPMFVEEPGQWVMVKGASHDSTSAAYPFQINGDSFIPSAAVSVKSGEPRDFAVFVYNATPDEVAWDASVNGRPASPSLLRETRSDEGTKMMFRYAPSAVAAGSATLAFTIRKKGSEDARQASVSLHVKP